jgi:hypothetical protein
MVVHDRGSVIHNKHTRFGRLNIKPNHRRGEGEVCQNPSRSATPAKSLAPHTPERLGATRLLRSTDAMVFLTHRIPERGIPRSDGAPRKAFAVCTDVGRLSQPTENVRCRTNELGEEIS